MTFRLCLVGIVLAAFAVGCSPAPDDSAGNAREMSKELPKSDPNVADMPSPLENYEPKAGTPPMQRKK